jgi:hypothetical protein
MEIDLMEGTKALAALSRAVMRLAFIRRILRNASMTGTCRFPRHYGLERDKKTHQVAEVGAGGG